MKYKDLSKYFLKFVRPIWYFHLYSINQGIYWMDYNKLSENEKKIIQYDNNYSDLIISDWDASYQALIKGIVGSKNSINNFDVSVNILPEDYYRFIKKYFSHFWIIYSLVFRILYFYNPYKEMRALWRTRRVSSIDVYKQSSNNNFYIEFTSPLLKESPLVSIIIPTYNRYDVLVELLKDLENQNYKNFEVIIIDQSENTPTGFYKKFKLKFKFIKLKYPALWRARNLGIKQSLSEYTIFLDDDSRINHNWIEQHLKCLDYFKVDISSGISRSMIGSKVPENYSYFHWSSQLDTGNVLIKKEVFRKIGLYDERFEKMRMGDGEFGLRSYLSGFKNISNPYACREHLKSYEGGLRNFGHWDAFHSKSFFTYRPVPSVFYYWRKYWGNQSAILACFFKIPLSIISYRFKSNSLMLFVSFFLFCILFPIIIIQIVLSWKASTRMLQNGPLISRI